MNEAVPREYFNSLLPILMIEGADLLEIGNLYEKPEYLALCERMTRDLLMHLAVCWEKYPR